MPTPLGNAFACSAAGSFFTFLCFIGWFDASSIGGGVTVFFGGILQLVNFVLVLIGTLSLWRETHPDALAKVAEPISKIREKLKLTDDKKFYTTWYAIIILLIILSFIGMAGQKCIFSLCIGVPFGAMGPLFNFLSLLIYAPALFFIHTHYKAPASTEPVKPAAATPAAPAADKV